MSADKLVIKLENIKTKDEVKHWKTVASDKPDAVSNAKVLFSRAEILVAIEARGNYVINKFGNRGTYVIDEFNLPVIELLCLYFRNNPKFETYQDPFGKTYSLAKGILLRSKEVGTGKTLLMKLFAVNAWQDDIKFESYSHMKVVNCMDVVFNYQSKGADGLDAYKAKTDNPKLGAWVFDELGREQTTSNFFGSKVNVMENILQKRYTLFTDFGIKTHATTNVVNKDDFDNLYGGYISNRMREMFNIVDMPGKSRRT